MSFNDIQKDFITEVQRGNVPGNSMVKVFGRNDSVVNGVWSLVSVSNPSGVFHASGSQVRIKAGGNPADAPSGVGAGSIMVLGLTTDLIDEREIIPTSGANASVFTTKSFWRIDRARVMSVGVYNGTNIGDITVENGEDMLTIMGDEGSTQHAVYTVPSGKTAQIVHIYMNSDGLKASDFRLMARLDMTDATPPVQAKQIKFYWDGVLGYVSHLAAPSISIPALTDIWMEARGGGANTEVSAGFDLLLLDDDPGHLV